MQTIRRCVFSALSLTCILIAGVTTCSSAEGLMPGTSSPGDQGKLVTDEFEDGLFQLVHDTRAADVFVDSSDWTVARISARDLTLDIQRVTGCKALLKHSRDNLSSHAVLVGTLGKSPVIDGLVQDGKIDVKDVRGQWETFAIAVVADPLPGVTQGLVIVGIFHNSGDHTIIP